MKKTGIAALPAILLVTLLACVSTAPPAPTASVGQAQAQTAQPPATQPAATAHVAVAQPSSPFFTGNGGRGITLAVLEPTGSGLSEDEMRWMPSLVQGSMTGDINMYSAITVVDRQNLEAILGEQGLSMMGYFSEEDFIRIGHIANARYVLAGSITRTATVYMIEFAVTDVQTGVRRASHPPTPVSIAGIENLSAVREATASLLGQLGVTLTARSRQELGRAVDIADAQAQTALARGITAQRQGFEVEAFSHFIQAGRHNPELEEAASRLGVLTAGLTHGPTGTGAAADLAWRRQWMDRLQETESFFASYTQTQPNFLIYEPNIREGAINHANETVELRVWMSLEPDEVWVASVNQAIGTVAGGLRDTGRAEAWDIDWPNNHVSFTQPFVNRSNNLAVVMEIFNDQGAGIGRQTVNIPAGFDIHSRISRNIIPRRWEGDAVFPAVDIHDMTGRMGIRVVSINGVPAEDAMRQNRVTVMSNEEFFRMTGMRRVPADASAFTVQPNGTLTLWGGTGTEVDIPFMVNGVRVTAIGNEVFRNRGLTRVSIPDTVTNIGNNAFRQNRLTSVTIPASVATIGAGAFQQNQLRSASITASVTSIGNNAFEQNDLANIAIPDSVITIGNDAFRSNRLASISIGNSVTNIGSRAFGHNTQLTSIIIPDSVRTIGGGAFFPTGGLASASDFRITSITIGADVDLVGNSGLSSNNTFDRFYAQNGRMAGTYIRSGSGNNATWIFTPR